jgi:predicted Zn-dependent protease
MRSIFKTEKVGQVRCSGSSLTVLMLIGAAMMLGGCAGLKWNKDFTPENKYYIGRSVSAQVLNQYKVYEDKQATRYINLLGQTLAKFSDLSEPYKGYHFIILDTPEVNAFAAPGAFIFVSRGMLRICATEDELAAVLSHEIGHIQYEHGVKVIRESRNWAGIVKLGKLIAQASTDSEIAELADKFGDDIGNSIETMMQKGYGRSAEKESDSASIQIMHRTGYDTNAVITMLKKMQKRVKPGSTGFGSTHPSPSVRIDAIKSLIKSPPAKANATRQKRFDTALAGARA